MPRGSKQGKTRVGGVAVNNQVPSTSASSMSRMPASASTPSSNNEDEVGVDEDTLEREMLDAYGTKYEGTVDGVGKGCMLVYRMNVWRREEGSFSLRKRKSVGASGDMLGKYLGREEFRVGMKNHYQTAMQHVFSRSGIRQARDKLRSYSGHCIHICNHEKVSDPHCVITGPNYPDDFAWIQDENSEYGTFVNGERIPSGEKRILIDGDIIGLGAPHDSPEHWGHWGDEKKKRGFVFKVKALSCSGADNMQTAEAEALDGSITATYAGLNNVVIVGKILRFLNFHELKTARMINKFWKDRADHILFPQTILRLGNLWIKRYLISPLQLAPEAISVKSYDIWNDMFYRNIKMIRRYNVPNLDIFEVDDGLFWNDVSILLV